MSGPRRRLVCRLLMLLVAAVALVGHVCVPSLEPAAAETTAPHPSSEGPGPAPAPGNDGHDALHGGSCEVASGGGVRLDPARPALAPGVATTVPRVVMLVPTVTATSPAPTVSPPLFLLHAALLI